MKEPLDVGGQSEVSGGPQEAWTDESVCVCAAWARYSWESFLFPICSDQSRRPACSRSGDTRVRGSGRVSALCQAALRNQTDLHAVEQGLSLEHPHLWPHSLQPKGLQTHSSNMSAVFTVQLSHPHVTIGETIALSRRTFIGKVCLCFLICCLG